MSSTTSRDTRLESPHDERPSAAGRRRWSSLLSDRAYWLVAGAILVVYLGSWLSQFQFVYGWLGDDYWSAYLKGVATVQDWRNAFAYYNGQGHYNALQPYFFVISYLPLASGVSLPSYSIPMLGDQTGQFRFLLLYTALLHGLVLFSWAWFVKTLSSDRVAALISVFLFATSPTLTLWTPQPDSRLLGLPFALLGLWLLFRARNTTRGFGTVCAAVFAAGSLFGLAQGIHYTSLYLIVPLTLTLWCPWLLSGWRRLSFWIAGAVFVIGCIWLQTTIEVVSYFVIGIPVQSGPTATLMELRAMHGSEQTLLGTVSLWRDWFASQMGVPLVAAVVAGWILWLARARTPAPRGGAGRAAVGLGIPLALIYLVFSGAMALFRQTSMLQPFLFLFAGIAITGVADKLRNEGLRVGAIVGLLTAIGVIPWVQASNVFEAHQALGRALDWAHSQRGDVRLAWLRVGWYGDSDSITTREELAALPSGTWLISYFPWQFVYGNPSLRPALERAAPLHAWNSLYGTDPVFAETRAYYATDFRSDPLLSAVRITDVASILAQTSGPQLSVTSVTADSMDYPSHEPLNVFDKDDSPDRQTAWMSAPTAMPHWLEIRLESPTSIGELSIVQPPTERSQSRIGDLRVQVQVAGDSGEYSTVWSGHDLNTQANIRAAWAPAPVSSLRVVVDRQLDGDKDTNQAMIEEVVFPGYQVTAPMPLRSFPTLDLEGLTPTKDGIDVTGSNLASATLVVDGVRWPTRASEQNGHLTATVPPEQLGQPIVAQAWLADSFRESNRLPMSGIPPVLRQFEPAVVVVGGSNNRLADGSLVILATVEQAQPGTELVFDQQPMVTSSEGKTLTAIVPRALADQTGTHAVALRNLFGESRVVGLDVLPTGTQP